VAQDEQDRVTEAAENGTLTTLEKQLDRDEEVAYHALTGEHRPPTGGLNIDTFPADEPKVDPFDCMADYMGRCRPGGFNLDTLPADEPLVDPMTCFTEACKGLQVSIQSVANSELAINMLKYMRIVKSSVVALEKLHGKELAAAHRGAK
jgi:hypothetical protein